jgi:signal peptide peptidase SppA
MSSRTACSRSRSRACCCTISPTPSAWATGYDYIWRAFERGCEDFKAGNIKGIALVEDSPGGMVAGCFDAVDKMSAAAAEAKVPVRAFAHESAYSAAYAVATVADHIAVSRTGGVGSIGVVTMHVDMSGALEQRGLKVEYIYESDGKVDGNPTEPLSERARGRLKARISNLYGIFVSAVARGRGLSEEEVKGLKSFTYSADEAVSNGLADSIGSLDDAVAAFAADLSSTSGEDEMSDKGNTAVDQAAHESAVNAAREEGRTAGLAAGREEGAAAERQVIFAVIDSDEGKKRPAAARALAAEGGRTLEQATAFLAKLPEEAPAAAAPSTDDEEPKAGPTPFDAAMKDGNPGIGAGAGQGDAEAAADGSDIIALARQFGVPGVRPVQQ